MKEEKKQQVTKWLYIKESRGLPVLYVPLQDDGKFVSIYCKTKEWIPFIIEEMRRRLEKEVTASNPGLQDIEISYKAAKQAYDIWNFFWNCCKAVGEEWRFPFIIRVRWLDKDKIKN